MESFWGTLKNESLSHYRFNNRDEAISVIREYIEIFYNRQRRHSRLGNISREQDNKNQKLSVKQITDNPAAIDCRVFLFNCRRYAIVLITEYA